MRTSPNFRAAMLVLAALACAFYLSATVADTVMRYALDRAGFSATAPSPRHPKIGPDISHCVNGNTQPLWDCIRFVEE